MRSWARVGPPSRSGLEERVSSFQLQIAGLGPLGEGIVAGCYIINTLADIEHCSLYA